MVKLRKKLHDVYDRHNLVLMTQQSKLVFIIEVTNIKTYSPKTNKLQNIFSKGMGARNISITNGK